MKTTCGNCGNAITICDICGERGYGAFDFTTSVEFGEKTYDIIIGDEIFISEIVGQKKDKDGIFEDEHESRDLCITCAAKLIRAAVDKWEAGTKTEGGV